MKRIKKWVIVKLVILFGLVSLKLIDGLGSFLMPMVYVLGVLSIALVIVFIVTGATSDTSGTETFVYDRMSVPYPILPQVVADDPEEDFGSRTRAMCNGCHRNPSEMTITTGNGDVLELCSRCARVGKAPARGRN